MPNTQTLTCDEHLMAELWVRSHDAERLPRLYREKHHILPHIFNTTGTLRVWRKRDHLRDAVMRLHMTKAKYDSAFARALLPRCKVRKQRIATVSRENLAAVALLRSWRAVDEPEKREQKETWEFLKHALDEDRLSSRKFFP